jgi:hypothetical protein
MERILDGLADMMIARLSWGIPQEVEPGLAKV